MNNEYDNIVVAIPHSESLPAEYDWAVYAGIAAERDKWTDWLTDELFNCNLPRVHVVRGRVFGEVQSSVFECACTGRLYRTFVDDRGQ